MSESLKSRSGIKLIRSQRSKFKKENNRLFRNKRKNRLMWRIWWSIWLTIINLIRRVCRWTRFVFACYTWPMSSLLISSRTPKTISSSLQTESVPTKKLIIIYIKREFENKRIIKKYLDEKSIFPIGFKKELRTIYFFE